jgi:hypothetical protein
MDRGAGWFDPAGGLLNSSGAGYICYQRVNPLQKAST